MKRLLLAATAAAVILLLIILLRGSVPPASSPAPSAAVQTMALRVTTVPRLVEAYGHVTGGPAARDIALPAGGIVARLAVVAGDEVAAGQVLARLTPDAQSVADLRKAEDARTAAQAARAHVAALLASHLATAADLAAADQTLRDAQAQLAALRAAGAGTARNIYAPAAGVITAVLVPQGSAQPAGASLFRLAETGHPAALVGLTEAAAKGLTPGAPAVLTPLDGGAPIQAVVARRAAALDPQSGLIDITLALSGAAPVGAPVRAQLQAGTLTGYVVPRDAVLTDEDGDYVFQDGADHLAQRAAVRVLGQSGEEEVLAPTLNPALPLITAGAYQLSDGMAVRPAGRN